jgi:hypothetical protein
MFYNKIKNACCLILVVVMASAFAVLSLPPQSAEAAPPRCHYTGTTDSEPELSDCSGLPDAIFPGGAPEDDKCYTVTGLLPGANVTEDSCADRKFIGETEYRVVNDCRPPAGVQLDRSNCQILDYLLTFINVLSGIVGVIVTLMIAYGGIRYSMAKDNPQEAAAAKEHIKNAVLALVIYLFMFAFLQWLVPGGVL